MSRELIQALQDPDRYDHDTRTQIGLRETHISWVLLTGSYAYKIKKPMDFGFLNFSSLERRRHFCEEELRLNRRLAPDLYLDVLPITGSPENPQIGGNGEPFEYCIRMREFDQDGMFGAVHERGELSGAHMDELADRIAQFHLSLPPIDPQRPLGDTKGVEAPMVQNFEQIRPLLDDSHRLQQLERIEAWSQSTFERLAPRIQERHDKGYVRECHGDLHLANITLHEGRVTVFDCIEFNDEFRWIDVCNDLAFLLMDLEDRGMPGYASRVLDRYLEHTADFGALPLLRFYQAYRAMVRGKIALFTMGNDGLGEAEKQALYARYCQYADLAESYAEIPDRYMIIMCGYSGSGKSFASQYLSEALPAIRIRSDVERKRLFGLKPGDSSRSALDQGIYTTEATHQTYERLGTLSSYILASGYPVIVDSAALRQQERDALYHIAEECGAPAVILACDAEESTLRERLHQRALQSDEVSEADERVLDVQMEKTEPLTDEEKRHTLRLQTDTPGILDDLARRIRTHFGHA